ncbi:hypothetical protein WR25_19056 [Diploscapter pachys]|uniref:Conserved oligomeric Golgi complex subunit 3 C-terminal domain-containing protein n=1 Tax=Diploscapter pachys TaxID=2018661 RepID=A0A2A2JK69_9BILA|nr:hypothetical protein WR25_19056 [Diploscapter pachys]
MIRNIEKGHGQNGGEKKANGAQNEEKSEGDSPVSASANSVSEPAKSAVSAVDLHCLWYPTVRRTVMCLAKLFRCLDMGVFQSLARDLLTMCCDSLDEAAIKIAAQPVKKTTRSKQLDAELFVVKHLLILREQTTPYRHAATQRADATLPTKDFSLDLSKFTNVIFDDASKWFSISSNNTFLELITTVPVQVSETSGDSRRVIDSRLRTRCNQLITTTADLVVGPLLRWTDIAEDEALKPDFDLSKHPSLVAKELRELSAAAFKALNTVWPDIKKIYALYIGVSETEAILLSPVRKRIADTFARAWAFASKRYDEEMKGIAGLPSVQQVYLMLNKET